MLRALGVLCLISFLTGCAVGVEHDYSRAVPQFLASQESSFAVGVQDRRPYVVVGDKDENFVGLSRGGYGNPFDVTTQSGKTLADEFAAAIANGLRQNNASVNVVRIAPNLPPIQARQALIYTGVEKSLLLTLNEWKADTYSNTALIYNIDLLVIGSDGTVLAHAARQGKDNLGGSVWNPPAHSRETVPIAFQSKLEELLGDPDIAKHLAS